jgi:hypothetical protein
VTWKLVYTRQTQKDAKKLASSGLKPKAQELLGKIILSEGTIRPETKVILTKCPTYPTIC